MHLKSAVNHLVMRFTSGSAHETRQTRSQIRPDKELAGKVVIITGASRGIGDACARLFSARGCRLALVARTRQGAMNELPDALVVQGDITRQEVREALIRRTIEKFGRIDILVNNAGVGLYATGSDSAPQHTRYLFELNAFAPFELARLVAPHMRQQKQGVIVNIGSVAGVVPLPWSVVYSATKSALYALSEGLRRELRHDGVKVTTVKPCIVKTRFRENVLGGAPPLGVESLKCAVSPEKVAQRVLRACEGKHRTLSVPSWQFYPYILTDQWIPALMDWYLKRTWTHRTDARR
jgi:short-subunit dehydrogenase